MLRAVPVAVTFTTSLGVAAVTFIAGAVAAKVTVGALNVIPPSKPTIPPPPPVSEARTKSLPLGAAVPPTQLAPSVTDPLPLAPFHVTMAAVTGRHAKASAVL